MVKSRKHFYLTFPKLHVSLKAAKKEKKKKNPLMTNADKKMAASFSKDKQEVMSKVKT